MPIISADVTEGVKDLIDKLVKSGLYKSKSEVIRDAVRQLSLKYNKK